MIATQLRKDLQTSFAHFLKGSPVIAGIALIGFLFSGSAFAGQRITEIKRLRG